MTAPHGGPAGNGTGPDADGVTARVLAERLDAVPGIGPATAQVILAEIGPDMSRFPTPEHLVSWAKLCPRTIQSGAENSAGPAGQGNPWFKGALGEAANAAARTGPWARERLLAQDFLAPPTAAASTRGTVSEARTMSWPGPEEALRPTPACRGSTP